MFGNHPKIEVQPTTTDKRLLLLGWDLVFLNFILVLPFYFGLPDTIPTHFNLKGEADGYGDKSNIWTIPLMGALTFSLLYFVTTKIKPWQYNYPTKVTKNNAPKLYAMSITMLSWMAVAVALLFLALVVHTLLKAMEIHTIDLGWLCMTIAIILTVGPFLMLLKMMKIPK